MAVIDQGKGNLWMGQTQAVENVDDMGQLCLLALHIFEAGWCIEKEVLNSDFSPHRASRRLKRSDFAPFSL